MHVATLHVRSEARLMKPVCGNERSFIMCKSLGATEQTMSRNPLLDSNTQTWTESLRPTCRQQGVNLPRKGPPASTGGHGVERK